ncbi:hypothetical protein JOM56_010444 [Amanita muscaria]
MSYYKYDYPASEQAHPRLGLEKQTKQRSPLADPEEAQSALHPQSRLATRIILPFFKSSKQASSAPAKRVQALSLLVFQMALDFVIVTVRAFSIGGNVTIGGNISAAAGPIGTGGIQTLLAHPAPMFSYSKSKEIIEAAEGLDESGLPESLYVPGLTGLGKHTADNPKMGY